MKISAPHNWQHDLIDNVDLSCIGDFYGKLSADILGGGRASSICVPVSKIKVKQEIKRIHNQGLKFNYLLNSNCLGNQELSFQTQKQISKLLDWLCDIAVDSVTVSMPYILLFIKKNYPNFKICVSTMANVDCPDKAKFWEDLGANKITLYEVTVNRNFELINKIRKKVRCQLQLIVNNGCLRDCPSTVCHSLLGSHSSQEKHISKGFAIDFYMIMCGYDKLKDPVNLISADWIRPEDICYYEDLGIDWIKIVNRGLSTCALKNIINAYTQRKYKGNLLDLLPSPSKSINYGKSHIPHLFKFFFHPFLINIFKLPKIKKVFSNIENIFYIDNNKLNGFLVSLQDKNCISKLCNDCNWCKKIADEVIKIDTKRINQAIEERKELIDQLVSGRSFKYF